MNEPNYPALYRSADALSLREQTKFFIALRWHLLCLAVGAAASLVPFPSIRLAVYQAVILTAALAFSAFLFISRPGKSWYASRAVAESIKTLTWRFVMRAQPFADEDDRARSRFRQKLKSVVEQNRDISARLTDFLAGEQVTNEMLRLRALDLVARKELYIHARIVEQQSWYAKKAGLNRRAAIVFSALILLLNAAAVALAIARIWAFDALMWPTDVVITLAAALLSWTQAKRFQELSTSYALAAHEISLVREQAAAVANERDLSKFVGDAENAFSREHTQWVAREDT